MSAPPVITSYSIHYTKLYDEFLRPALATNSFRLALPRSSERHARIQADFNRGLAAITADGTLARIRARHGFFDPRSQDSADVSLVVGKSNQYIIQLEQMTTELGATRNNFV